MPLVRSTRRTAPAFVLVATLASTALAADPTAALVNPSGPTPSKVGRAEQDPCAGASPATSPACSLARMSLDQRVGQLFMVGTPAEAPSPLTRSHIRRYHVGNVMLTGRSHAGTRAPARTAAAMQAATTRPATTGVGLLVSTDQEGGDVRVLQGSGLDAMPAAVEQGRWRPETLERHAQRWGTQLRAAGVNLNLGPVMDTVPGPAAARANPPIGHYGRQFGYHPDEVARHGTAFTRGMARAGVATTAKHFPGLGRVRANTDATAGVTDRVTRRHDPYLAPFRAAVETGTPFVMMSTARYPRLDPKAPAAFSPFVIGTVLRGDLGFDGVVVSDDLGTARQVARWPYGARAVRFLAAGGDVVLTVDPGTLPAMYRAVLARAHAVPAFREAVSDSALRVLRAKHDLDLLDGATVPHPAVPRERQPRPEHDGRQRSSDPIHSSTPDDVLGRLADRLR